MPGTARIAINGPIVSAPDSETPYPYTTLQDVQSQLEWQSPYTEVYCTINSPGGNADEGFGIFDLLRALPVPVTTEAVGQCSSIASIIYLAGTTRRSHRNLNYTVHFPFGGCNGTAAEMQAYTDKLVQLQQRLVTTYTTRGTVAAEVITPLLEADTALTPEQMLAFGFSTAIVEPVLAMASFKPVAAVATVNPTPANPAGSNPPATNTPMPTVKPAAGSKPAAATAPRKTLAQHFQEIKALVLGTPMLALSVTTDAGAAITIDTGDRETPEPGDAANDADGNPLADATYTLTDGAVVVVKDGKVETYTPAPAADAAAQAAAAAAAQASTAPQANADAEPTTLEEAQALIAQLRANPPQASAAGAGKTRYQRDMEARLATLGSLIQSNGSAPQASDTTNPILVSRSQPASAVKDANSGDAKAAAAANIKDRAQRRAQSGR